MIDSESYSDFVLVEKIIWSGILSKKKSSKKFETEEEKWKRKKSTLGRIPFSQEKLFNHRTLSLRKNFEKIFIQPKDMTQSLQLVDYKKGCFSLFFGVFQSQLMINFALYLLFE